MLGRVKASTWMPVLFLVGCGGHAPAPHQPSPSPSPSVAACGLEQQLISQDADARAAPWTIARHLARNFADGNVSWVMRDADYQKYVVGPRAERWGRCNPTGCYLFAAPTAVIRAAFEGAMADGHHDPAALGKALGLPAKNLEGPLRLMTLDLDTAAACARLPVDTDPGVWACKTTDDHDCFEFGGYTSGGVPEVMVIDAPVAGTAIDLVP